MLAEESNGGFSGYYLIFDNRWNILHLIVGAFVILISSFRFSYRPRFLLSLFFPIATFSSVIISGVIWLYSPYSQGVILAGMSASCYGALASAIDVSLLLSKAEIMKKWNIFISSIIAISVLLIWYGGALSSPPSIQVRLPALILRFTGYALLSFFLVRKYGIISRSESKLARAHYRFSFLGGLSATSFQLLPQSS